MVNEEPTTEAALGFRARLLGVLALVALVHLPLLRFGFIYDDGWTLRSNGFLRPGLFDPALLLSPEALARHVPDAFRPTLVVFDALSLRVLGLDPRLHHGLSIALHLGVCALLARLLRRLELDEDVVLASVACFGLLAIHAEAVAVISFREDLLAAALGLLAMLAALRALTAPAMRGALPWTLAAAGAMALACGAKLSAAPLPALLLLLVWLGPALKLPLKLERPRLALVLTGLALGVALALAQTFVVHGGSPYGVDNPRILAQRLGLAPILAASTVIHVGYLQQILVPLGLSPEYVDHGASWLAPATLAASALLLALVGAALLGRRRWPLASLALLAWVLACVPTSNLVGLPNMRADRFMYLPSLVPCVALAAGLLQLGRRISVQDRWAPLALFVLVQGSFGAAASRAYVSNTTLWHEAARRAPDSARAQALLGLERVGAARQGEHTREAVLEAAGAARRGPARAPRAGSRRGARAPRPPFRGPRGCAPCGAPAK